MNKGKNRSPNCVKEDLSQSCKMLFSQYVTLNGRGSSLRQLSSIIQSLTIISLGRSISSRFVFYRINYNSIGFSSLELELIHERSISFQYGKKGHNYTSEISNKRPSVRQQQYTRNTRYYQVQINRACRALCFNSRMN